MLDTNLQTKPRWNEVKIYSAMNLQNSLLWTEYRINRFHWECASEKRQLKKIEWKFVVAVCKFAERPEGITKNSSFPFVVYWFIFHFFCSLLSWRLLYTYIFYQFEHYFFFCLPVLKFFSPSLKPNIFHSKSFALVTSGDFRSDLCACAELLHRPSEACGSVRCVRSIPPYFFLLFVIAGWHIEIGACGHSLPCTFSDIGLSWSF